MKNISRSKNRYLASHAVPESPLGRPVTSRFNPPFEAQLIVATSDEGRVCQSNKTYCQSSKSKSNDRHHTGHGHVEIS